MTKTTSILFIVLGFFLAFISGFQFAAGGDFVFLFGVIGGMYIIFKGVSMSV